MLSGAVTLTSDGYESALIIRRYHGITGINQFYGNFTHTFTSINMQYTEMWYQTMSSHIA